MHFDANVVIMVISAAARKKLKEEFLKNSKVSDEAVVKEVCLRHPLYRAVD